MHHSDLPYNPLLNSKEGMFERPPLSFKGRTTGGVRNRPHYFHRSYMIIRLTLGVLAGASKNVEHTFEVYSTLLLPKPCSTLHRQDNFSKILPLLHRSLCFGSALQWKNGMHDRFQFTGREEF